MFVMDDIWMFSFTASCFLSFCAQVALGVGLFLPPLSLSLFFCVSFFFFLMMGKRRCVGAFFAPRGPEFFDAWTARAVHGSDAASPPHGPLCDGGRPLGGGGLGARVPSDEAKRTECTTPQLQATHTRKVKKFLTEKSRNGWKKEERETRQ
ncbi:hypothetical protein TW95_gp1685 [Pandoravirus inopinatum]|uniref:Transmembrane protein n=1 Tax=Pandoravirus inopinatum TaxID=1605721 RepID=A0A0B5J464_9VIRU|nr:hypothetical protein TW95_gp1685 [Pandoravirus inopinatum]AJF98419.1 hypothetical protein [Pandoravirus inopinatum]